MKHYCCRDFLSAIEYNAISRSRYPSGIEYFINIKVQGKNEKTRIYYCPYCGEGLE